MLQPIPEIDFNSDFIFSEYSDCSQSFTITTPFKYLDNNNIIIFVDICGDDCYILSDGGDSVLKAMLSDVDVESINFLRMLEDLSRCCDIKWNDFDNSIECYTNKESFKKGIYNIIVASIKIQSLGKI